jgi:hypothetical protein
MHNVFFGDEEPGAAPKSYAVLCQREDSTAPISSVFADAFKEAASPALFRVVDCETPMLTSGQTIAKRFGLNVDKRPTIFLSGSVGEPQQIPDKHLKTGHMLTQYLRGRLEKRAAKIETTQDLRSKCLNQKVCGLLLKGGKKVASHVKDAMGQLVKEYPDAVFASVDASNLYVLHLEEYLPELVKDQARFVVFQKVSGSLKTGDSRLITSMVAADAGGYGPWSNAVAAVLQGTAALTKLPSLPQIKTRTKKLEEQERAKRQRKAEQKRRAEGGEQQGGSGSTAEEGDDDMKSERRAERERRRREHREQNNVREKTPEELAEIERQRRIRMEQEAAKWNMAPEDAPEEGDYVDDEGSTYTIMEDGEEETVVVEDLDAYDDDDEDVIDLD